MDDFYAFKNELCIWLRTYVRCKLIFWEIENILVIKIKLELSVQTCRKNKKLMILLQSEIKLYASNENILRDDKNKQYNPYYITSVAPNIVHCGGNLLFQNLYFQMRKILMSGFSFLQIPYVHQILTNQRNENSFYSVVRSKSDVWLNLISSGIAKCMQTLTPYDYAGVPNHLWT